MGLERRDRAVHGQHEVNPAGVNPAGEEPRVRPEPFMAPCPRRCSATKVRSTSDRTGPSAHSGAKFDRARRQVAHELPNYPDT